MALVTSSRTNVYQVTFLPANSSVERVLRHPADEFGNGEDRAMWADEFIEYYEARGDEVIEVRYFGDEGDPSEVVYANPRF